MDSKLKAEKRLKNIRSKRGMTQFEVAEMTDIHVNFYARIERGDENSSYDILEKITKGLKTKSSKFLFF